MDGNMPRPAKTRRNAELVQMRYAGVSWSIIARRFNISEATACKIFKRDSSAEGRYEATTKTLSFRRC